MSQPLRTFRRETDRPGGRTDGRPRNPAEPSPLPPFPNSVSRSNAPVPQPVPRGCLFRLCASPERTYTSDTQSTKEMRRHHIRVPANGRVRLATTFELPRQPEPSANQTSRTLFTRRTCSLLGVQVVSCGSFVPEQVVTNQDLNAQFGFDSNWIEQRTGILERRHAPPEMATSDMCVEAARKAIRARTNRSAGY